LVRVLKCIKCKSCVSSGDGGLSGGFTLFIQTPKHAGVNILTEDDIQLHSKLLVDISNLAVESGGL
jgi:hypothetical protein